MDREFWVFVASIALCSFRHIFQRVLITAAPRYFPLFLLFSFVFFEWTGGIWQREGSWGQDLGELEPHTVLLYEIKRSKDRSFFFLFLGFRMVMYFPEYDMLCIFRRCVFVSWPT